MVWVERSVFAFLIVFMVIMIMTMVAENDALRRSLARNQTTCVSNSTHYKVVEMCERLAEVNRQCLYLHRAVRSKLGGSRNDEVWSGAREIDQGGSGR